MAPIFVNNLDVQYAGTGVFCKNWLVKLIKEKTEHAAMILNCDGLHYIVSRQFDDLAIALFAAAPETFVKKMAPIFVNNLDVQYQGQGAFCTRWINSIETYKKDPESFLISAYVKLFNDGQSTANTSKLLCKLLDGKAKIARHAIKEICFSRFTTPEACHLRDRLLDLAAGAYLAKALPLHITCFNDGAEAAYNTEQLLHLVGRDKTLAPRLINDLLFSRFTSPQTQQLRDRLHDLEPDAYLAKAVPQHVKGFNEECELGYNAEQLLHLVGKDRTLAPRLINDLDFSRFVSPDTHQLRDRLFALEPDAYMNKAVLQHIVAVNKGLDLPYYARQFLRFLERAPALAPHLVHEIEFSRFGCIGMEKLRDRVREISPDTYTEKTRQNAGVVIPFVARQFPKSARAFSCRIGPDGRSGMLPRLGALLTASRG